jgi:hypothetical protein
MKSIPACLLGGLLGASTLAAEFSVLSLDRAGSLTWTNSVSTGLYRLEWASSATGAWHRIESLTNLALVTATNTVVEVKVPMLYRVVWLNPSLLGAYAYSGYDPAGNLVVTGRLSLVSLTNGRLQGQWNLQQAGDTSVRLGPQIGTGVLDGHVVGNQVWIGLNPNYVDNNVNLLGLWGGNTLTGRWEYYGFFGPLGQGPFTAVRQPGP